MLGKIMIYAGMAALLVGSAVAADSASGGTKRDVAQPILLNRTASETRHALFSHSSHQKVECSFCHHKKVNDSPLVSCATQGCHDNLDRSDKSEQSYFQAMHMRTSEKSCVGCHASMAKNDDALKERFRGCAPCHKSPQQ